MTQQVQISEMGEKLRQGVVLARKKMLKELALHGENVVVADDNGKIMTIPAAEIIAKHKEYQ